MDNTLNRHGVSVIIPAHNAEKTIYDAIKSVRDFGLADVEILVVENASTDATYDTVLSLLPDFPEVKLIQSEKGVSQARNAGLKEACGEWIMFLDSDDTMLPDSGEIIEKCIYNNTLDIWMFGHMAGDLKRSVTDIEKPAYYFGKDEVEKATLMFLTDPTRYLQVWAKLFKADIIRENGLCFNTDLILAEDSDFTLRYLKYCERICLSNYILYEYSLNDTSIMRKYTGHKREEYLKSMAVTGKNFDYSEEAKYAYAFYILMHMNITMVREIYLPNNGLKASEKYRQMKETMRIPAFADAIRAVAFKDCFSARMSPILFAKMHLYPLCKSAYKTRVKMNLKREGKKT